MGYTFLLQSASLEAFCGCNMHAKRKPTPHGSNFHDLGPALTIAAALRIHRLLWAIWFCWSQQVLSYSLAVKCILKENRHPMDQFPWSWTRTYQHSTQHKLIPGYTVLLKAVSLEACLLCNMHPERKQTTHRSSFHGHGPSLPPQRPGPLLWDGGKLIKSRGIQSFCFRILRCKVKGERNFLKQRA